MKSLDSFCNNIFGLKYENVIAAALQKDYKQFYIPKKNGFREINYLNKTAELSKLQYDLLNNFLSVQSLPVPVKGFVKSGSYFHYLKPHIGSEYFLRLDIKNFFGSVTEKHFTDSFIDFNPVIDEDEKEQAVSLIWDIISYNQYIPQGACCSPAVSNIIMIRPDQRILKYCQAYNIVYTRYADDLLFSSKVFDFDSKRWFIKKIKHILKSKGFSVNYSKLKIA